eukprot:11171186-Lingulodinium_polyedra.AAC.1
MAARKIVLRSAAAASARQVGMHEQLQCTSLGSAAFHHSEGVLAGMYIRAGLTHVVSLDPAIILMHVSCRACARMQEA